MKKTPFIAGLALVCALGAFWLVAEYARAPQAGQYHAPGLHPVSAEEVAENAEPLAAALLLVVYEAFGKSDEGEIYDTLAQVSAADALEQLYLERAGAMAGGGLKTNQTIHEMRISDIEMRRSGTVFQLVTRWHVVGEVAHGEHSHVRGNAYSADLTIEPVGDAWRITGFELLDVDRTEAGAPEQAHGS
jgi:hypothetical protein